MRGKMVGTAQERLCPPYDFVAASMLGHHAPFGDHGFAHLPGILRAGDLVEFHRDLLALELKLMAGKTSGVSASRLQVPF
jgi:hypothetical protein